MEWQPIETAPAKEEYPDLVLLWIVGAGDERKGCSAFGRVYQHSNNEKFAVASGYSGQWEITHWMPLPEPPTQ